LNTGARRGNPRKVSRDERQHGEKSGRRFRVADGVVGEILDGEAVLLDTQRGHYYRLNRTGTLLWTSLERDGRVDRAIEAILKEFPVAPDEVRRDIQAVLGELESFHLLVRDDEPTRRPDTDARSEPKDAG